MIWLLSSLGGVSIIAFIAVGLLVGWPLVMNKYVLGALMIVLACVGAGIAWESAKNKYREEGKAECVAANVAAQAERMKQNAAFDADLSDSVKEAQASLAAAQVQRITSTKEREAHAHVTQTTDAVMVVTRGFVRDYNASLPGRRAEVPAAKAADDDAAAGIPASIVSRDIGRNNDKCAELIDDIATIEAQRYAACLAWDKRYGTQSGCSK